MFNWVVALTSQVCTRARTYKSRLPSRGPSKGGGLLKHCWFSCSTWRSFHIAIYSLYLALEWLFALPQYLASFAYLLLTPTTTIMIKKNRVLSRGVMHTSVYRANHACLCLAASPIYVGRNACVCVLLAGSYPIVHCCHACVVLHSHLVCLWRTKYGWSTEHWPIWTDSGRIWLHCWASC